VWEAKCKKCKAAGEKLFLKGEKCFGAKCPLVRSAYATGKGQRKGKRRSKITTYGRQLREKQKTKKVYGIGERQFRHYLQIASGQKGSLPEVLAQLLESRFDSVIFRLGFAPSRSMAHQLANHGHFLLNGRRHNIASAILKKDDTITIRSQSLKEVPFKDLGKKLKDYKCPSYLKLDLKKMKGTVLKEPDLEELQLPFNFVSIVEFYSR